MKNYKFNPNDAVLVIDGEYRGWVGYALEREDETAFDDVKVRLFANDGEISERLIDIDYVKNLESQTVEPEWIHRNG